MKKLIVKIAVKLKDATYYSLQGLKAAFKGEFAFRLEVIVGVIALPFAILLGQSALERILLIASLFLILIVELLNSAIENTINRIDTDWHPLSKKSKDMGSAAVLLAIINALMVWLIIMSSH
jgi:diacylglycerol kinase (ATP)